MSEEAEEWQVFEYAAKTVLEQGGYTRIETPVFEKEELFVRGIGESTDVVNKEMFSVFSGGNLEKIKAGEELPSKSKFALRPEGTAGVVRASIENGLLEDSNQPLRGWYAGKMFRAERPQKGRQREFHQIGLECIGSDDAFLDAQAIVLMHDTFTMFGIDTNKTQLHLNTMGCDECRPAWRDAVKKHIDAHKGEMCETCLERAEKNPLRAFDCKNEGCGRVMSDAPKIDEFLCLDCRTHFEKVKRLLNVAEMEYVLDSTLVRGLDYYTRTVFEVTFNEGLGAQNAIGGGGRYDNLVEELGGKSIAALGFAMGFERCLLAKKACGCKQFEKPGPDFFFIVLSDGAKRFADEFAMDPEHMLYSFEMDFRPAQKGAPPYRSLKSQLRLANKMKAGHAIILGDDEMRSETATLKGLFAHTETKIPFEKLKSSDYLSNLTMEAWENEL